MGEIIVVAIGGNSLIRDAAHMSVGDQYESVVETAKHLADIVESGFRVVIVHGNGPQVGFILRRSALAFEAAGLHEVPLSSCVADTQGAIGFQIQQALDIEMNKRGLTKKTATLVTRVAVDENDAKFQNPSKPIGSFFSAEQRAELERRYPEWQFMEDSGRGFRRVVPSPEPIEIVELELIKDVIAKDYVVVACGGGGIPVVKKPEGYLAVDAVIDKDLASALLSAQIDATRFVISTGVDYVYLNFGKENEQRLKQVTLQQIKTYVEEGHFAAGSMLPKIEAAIRFLENGGEEVIITSPEYIKMALNYEIGTRITQ